MAATPDGDNVRKSPLAEIIQPFIDLVHAPRAIWGVNLSYLLEGMVYFGLLNYLAMYMNDYIGLNDLHAGRMVGVLTAGITIMMFFLGTVADRRGVRFALLMAFTLLIVGRVVISAAPVVDPSHVEISVDEAGRNDPVFVFTDAEPTPVMAEPVAAEPLADAAKATAAGDEAVEAPSPGIGSTAFYLALVGILIVTVGYGMYQPGAYAAVRQFTTPRTAGMSFAMLYALMNLGGWLPTFAFMVRNNEYDAFGKTFQGGGAGILGTAWVYTGITAVALVVTYFLLSRRTVEKAIAAAKAERERLAAAEPAADEAAAAPKPAAAPVKRREGFLGAIVDYVLNHPMRDVKFSFFIFCLIPVQTLFAHNWLTLPMYVERAYVDTWPWISQNFEPAVNFNPLLIFILVPIVTALTQRAKVYNMMIIGTLVMALPTFLLAIGPYWWTLLAYLVIMTIGEAMWQPRFLQYAAEIAPEGRTGAYMGVAQLPWFLTKMLVPLYSGWFLQRYVPEGGIPNSEFMWFIYGLIAVSSTVMLVLARNWVGKDFKTSA